MKRASGGGSDLPSWFWLWIPVLLFPLAYAGLVNPRFARLLDPGEMGIIENGTVLFLVVAVVAGVMALKGAMARSKRLAMWIVLIALGSFYFGGEEISWGQHYAGWQTPEAWAQVNNQHETNLHNLGALFDQFPRTLLTLAALVGGIAVPLLVATKRLRFDPDRLQRWIWPTFVCIPACLLSLAPKVLAKTAKLVDVDLASISHARGRDQGVLPGRLSLVALRTAQRREENRRRRVGRSAAV